MQPCWALLSKTLKKIIDPRLFSVYIYIYIVTSRAVPGWRGARCEVWSGAPLGPFAMALRGGGGVRFRSSRGAGPGATAPVAPPKGRPWWRVGCLPPNYQHLPVPYSPPFTRLPTGVGVWERRGAETARSGGMWWGTHLKWMEPHHRRCYMPSAPLLWRPVSSPCMHAGVFVGPGRERRAWRTAPARRLTGQDAGPYPWKRRGPKGGRSRR